MFALVKSLRRRDDWKVPTYNLEFFQIGRYSHPIFSEKGGWPPALERYMAEKSKKEGYSKSRLPSFTKEEIQLIRGTNYWFPRGLNAALSNLTLLTQSIQVSINPR